MIRKRNRNRLKSVYLVRCGEFYKVGLADNVQERIATLQTASPYQVEFIRSWQARNAKQQEQMIHGLLWRYHERGEWFKLPTGVVLVLACPIPSNPIKALRKIIR